MTKQMLMRGAAAGSLVLSLLIPSAAFAATSIDAALNASASANAGGVSASTTISATVMTRAKSKADTEISRRTTALNDMITRIGSMTKVSDSFKQTLTANVQSQISSLATLKTKIDADTDGATLKADVQSITQSYRIFMLVMPQARIAAAADREATIIGMLNQIGAKLQARLESAQSAGADVTALASALTDMAAKINNAQTQAQTAVSGTATLAPDNGDASVAASNTTALKAGRTDIKTAQQDLVAARKDVDTILNGLKKIEASASVSASTSAQTGAGQ